MTLTSATSKNDYTGDNTLGTYSYTFRITAQTDLIVTVADLDDVEVIPAITTDYSVTDVGVVDGGTIVFVEDGQDYLNGSGKLKSGYKLNIRRVRPLTQNTDIRNQGDFFPETHEDEFDDLVMILQQLQEQIDRAVKVGATQDGVDAEALAAAIAAAVAAADAAAASASAASASAAAASSSESNAASSAADAAVAQAAAEAAQVAAEAAQVAAEAVTLSAKLVTFSRDTSIASGNQAVTGVGFQPVAVFVVAAITQTSQISVGFTDGSDAGRLAIQNQVSADAYNVSLEIIQLVQDGNKSYDGFISSFDADGFTIAWTKVGVKTGTVNMRAICIR